MIWVTAAAAALGGLIFHVANKMLNDRGAYIRNFSNLKKKLLGWKKIRNRSVVQGLSENRVMRALPPEEIARLIPHLRKESFAAGKNIFSEGDHGEHLYFIATGRVRVSRNEGGQVAELGANDIFGEMALITGQPRLATAVAVDATATYSLSHKDLLALAENSPGLQKSLSQIAEERLHDLENREMINEIQTAEWRKRALVELSDAPISLTQSEITEHSQQAMQKPNAGTAIYLGLLIDGIPESLVIGLLASQPSGMSLAFIVGVFLANLPESLSSSVTMFSGGMSKFKIMGMWFSLVAMMAVGAAIGAALFPGTPSGHDLLYIAGIEGLAAGAMLTAIAESFLPEAYEQGGDIVGLTTLAGFLSALLVKLI